jgi:hypothetical protein
LLVGIKRPALLERVFFLKNQKLDQARIKPSWV